MRISVSDVGAYPTCPEGSYRFLFVGHFARTGAMGHSTRAFDIDTERPTFLHIEAARRHLAKNAGVSADSMCIVNVIPLA